MALEFFDYRRDLRNVVVTPEIRSRFMRIEAGAITGSHTHDIGHEVFLVLEGQIEFDVAGERATLGPGQMCFARADQPHTLRALGDQPATIYLSVTPHLEPTHTSWDGQGNKLPPRYGNATAQEASTAPQIPLEELADQHLAAAQALASAAAENARAQEAAVAALKHALASGDRAATKTAVDSMWAQIYPTYKRLQAFETLWNELAARATSSKP